MHTQNHAQKWLMLRAMVSVRASKAAARSRKNIAIRFRRSPIDREL